MVTLNRCDHVFVPSISGRDLTTCVGADGNRVEHRAECHRSGLVSSLD